MKLIINRLGVVGTILLAGCCLFTAVAIAAVVSGTSTTNISAHVTYTQLTINKPTVSIGDVMLASIAVNDGSIVNVTAPSGWTQVARTDNDINVALISFWKVVGASEPSTYTWTIDEQTKAVGGITPYSGIDTTNPIDAAAGNIGFDTLATTSAITTATNNEEIVALFATDVNKSFSVPTGMTQKYGLAHLAAGPFTAAFDVLQVSAGTAASKLSTITGNKPRSWAAQQIALRSSGNLQNGLVSYWKLDESSGNASDSFGSHPLTNNNATTYNSGKINNGVDFGSNNNNQNLSTNGTGNIGYQKSSPFTISFWYKPAVDPTNNGNGEYLWTAQNASQANRAYVLYWQVGGHYQLTFSPGDAINVGSNGFDVVDTHLTVGNWYHISLTWDGTTAKGYLNGSLIGSNSPSIGNGSGGFADDFTVGSHSYNGSGDPPFFCCSWVQGKMDEVGWWSRALTSGEVSSLYNGGTGLQYPF